MNQIARYILTIIIINCSIYSNSHAEQGNAANKRQLQRELPVYFALSAVMQFHISPKELNPAVALEIANNYLDTLDPDRLFISAEQVDEIRAASSRIPEELQNNQAMFALNVYDIFKNDVHEKVKLINRLLVGLQFLEVSAEKNAVYHAGANLPWVRSQEMELLWSHYLRNAFIEGQIQGKSIDDIKATIRKKFQKLAKKINAHTDLEVIGEYLNVVLSTFDPHTNYLPPVAANDMTIKIDGELVGIGATVQNSGAGVIIMELVPNGPASSSGSIFVGDRILAVAQNERGSFEDLSEDDDISGVVAKLRGQVDSIVRLKIAPQGNVEKTTIIKLVRKKILLADLVPSVKIYQDLPGLAGKKIAVIKVPTFNVQTTKVTKAILQNLAKERDLMAVAINLTGNGGGLLKEAIDFAGLFVPSGVITQSFDGVSVKQFEDQDPEIYYAGPLAVIVDGNSASASEIVAGFMKDSRRALVLGERTFGKGTIQTLIPPQEVPSFVQLEEEYGPLGLGEVKITVGSYHLPSGNSPQYYGVMPDVLVPAKVYSDNYGERSLKNSVKVHPIQMAYFPIGHGYQPVNRDVLTVLQGKSQERLNQNAVMTAIDELRAIAQQVEQEQVLSLDFEQRQLTAHLLGQRKMQAINLLRAQLQLPPLLTENDLEKINFLEQKQVSDFISEVPIKEDLLILVDYINLTKSSEQ